MGYPDFRLSDYCDGYVFLEPLNAFEPLTVDDEAITQTNLQAARVALGNLRLRAEIDTVPKYLQHLRDVASMSSVKALWPRVEKATETRPK